jgi:hypothetical protein
MTRRLLLSLLAGACAAAAAPEPLPLWERLKVTAEVKNEPIRAALERVLGPPGGVRTGFHPWGSADPGIPEVPISISIRNVNWVNALILMVGSAREAGIRLAVGRDGDLHVVHYNPTLQGDPPPKEFVRQTLAEKVDLKLSAHPLKDLRSHRFGGKNAILRVDPELHDLRVTLEAAGVTPEEAVRRIVAEAQRQAPRVTYTRGGHVFVIHLLGSNKNGRRFAPPAAHVPSP